MVLHHGCRFCELVPCLVYIASLRLVWGNSSFSIGHVRGIRIATCTQEAGWKVKESIADNATTPGLASIVETPS